MVLVFTSANYRIDYLSNFANKDLIQNKSTSILYDESGVLRANSSFKIPATQLQKWLVVEDTLLKKILNELHYPLELYEIGGVGKVIISFTVDENGKFNDFRFETYQYGLGDRYNLFIGACFNAVLSSSGNDLPSEFYADNKLEKYYLPFNFEIVENIPNTVREIKDGSLTIKANYIRPVEHPR